MSVLCLYYKIKERMNGKKYARSVVLLSGGLDSSIALHLAARESGAVYALSVCYGQLHEKELACARWQAAAVGVVEHHVVDLSLASWGGSSLTDSGVAIDSGDLQRTETPNTYVPARNMVFISVAASLAEAVGASAIYLGVSEADYSGYVDCRAEFIAAMAEAVNAGTERKAMGGEPIVLETPFLHMRKADEVRLAGELGVDLSHTWTCYTGGDTPCGECDSCLLRARAFSEAGVADPLIAR